MWIAFLCLSIGKTARMVLIWELSLGFSEYCALKLGLYI
jgi:hypothetical protein